MIHPGKVLKQVLHSFFRKPATVRYPAVKIEMPEGFRGKIKFFPEKCIGCKMCMRDCPSGAITILKDEQNKFVAEVNLGRCIYCGQCVDSCLKKALELTPEFELAQLDSAKLKVVFRAEPEQRAEKKT